jgi:hypothetical protein
MAIAPSSRRDRSTSVCQRTTFHARGISMTRSPSITWTRAKRPPTRRDIAVVAACVRYATGVRPRGWIIT